MVRIGLISDTHGYIDDAILAHFEDCDEIWHAGDFGTLEVSDKLSGIQKLRGVYGNIDGKEIKAEHPKDQKFICEGFRIWMTHIGGYPGKYSKEVKSELTANPPDIFICGHSHILRVMQDKSLHNMLFINPGAAGKEGFHRVRTIMKFDLINKKVENMKAIELGKRG